MHFSPARNMRIIERAQGISARDVFPFHLPSTALSRPTRNQNTGSGSSTTPVTNHTGVVFFIFCFPYAYAHFMK